MTLREDFVTVVWFELWIQNYLYICCHRLAVHHHVQCLPKNTRQSPSAHIKSTNHVLCSNMILHNIWKYGYFKINLDAQHTEWHCAWFMTIKWRSCILHYSCETCGLNEAWSYRSNTHSFVCWCGGTEHIGLAASFLLRHWTVSSKTRCFSIRMTVITCFGSRQSFWGSLRSFWPTISSELISDFAVLLTNAELQLNKNNWGQEMIKCISKND